MVNSPAGSGQLHFRHKSPHINQKLINRKSEITLPDWQLCPPLENSLNSWQDSYILAEGSLFSRFESTLINSSCETTKNIIFRGFRQIRKYVAFSKQKINEVFVKKSEAPSQVCVILFLGFTQKTRYLTEMNPMNPPYFTYIHSNSLKFSK